jgi:uncharacterized SAM-binding protein YcdF (DUF218 family)
MKLFAYPSRIEGIFSVLEKKFVMVRNKKKARYLLLFLLFCVSLLYFLSGAILTRIGKFLVFDEQPSVSDAVVVLNTGVEYYPRLIEAAELFRRRLVRTIVINGNRKTDLLRSLEEKGFQPCCAWYEDRIRILELFGVPREAILTISVENAYDTITEAIAVGKTLIDKGVLRIIITTSKFHTRRARRIWINNYPNQLSIQVVAARTDPYSPESWWRDGRQVRWVLAEYGAWVYYFWSRII